MSLLIKLTALKTCSLYVVTGNSDKYADIFIGIKIPYSLVIMFFLICSLSDFHGILVGRGELCFISRALQNLVYVQ